MWFSQYASASVATAISSTTLSRALSPGLGCVDPIVHVRVSRAPARPRAPPFADVLVTIAHDLLLDEVIDPPAAAMWADEIRFPPYISDFRHGIASQHDDDFRRERPP